MEALLAAIHLEQNKKCHLTSSKTNCKVEMVETTKYVNVSVYMGVVCVQVADVASQLKGLAEDNVGVFCPSSATRP